MLNTAPLGGVVAESMREDDLTKIYKIQDAMGEERTLANGTIRALEYLTVRVGWVWENERY